MKHTAEHHLTLDEYEWNTLQDVVAEYQQAHEDRDWDSTRDRLCRALGLRTQWQEQQKAHDAVRVTEFLKRPF